MGDNWIPVGQHMPDADENVLLWYVDAKHGEDWTMGWWGEDVWHDASGWPMVPGVHTVTHWARPTGPNTKLSSPQGLLQRPVGPA